jgi:hypothetical protein
MVFGPIYRPLERGPWTYTCALQNAEDDAKNGSDDEKDCKADEQTPYPGGAPPNYCPSF